MAELQAGTEVAGCRIESVLGRGGMGVVYRAVQLSLDRVVALKAIVPDLARDDEFRKRFKYESRLAASIEHPNVIPIYEAGERDGLLYLIMRYVEGTDMRTLLDMEGALEPHRAAQLVVQVAAALTAAHRRQLVHRDVKPANVLISSAGGEEHAYLTDFGIARHLATTKGLTRTGAVVGTLDYIAPERLEHPAGDARSDIYALGCVLFEALTGSVPYPRDSEPAKMFAHASAPVPSPRELRAEVPEELDELVRRSMAKDPGERPATTAELAEALVAFGAGAPGGARDEPSDGARPGGGPGAATLPAPTDAQAHEPTAPSSEPTQAAETDEVGDRAPATRAAAGRPVAPARSSSQPPARRRQAPRGAVLGGLAAAGVIALAVLVLAGGGSGGESGSDNRGGGGAAQGKGALLSPTALPPVDVGPGADGVAVGEGFVWVADKDDDVVTRVNPSSRRKAGTIPVGSEPDSIAIGEGGVWVTNTGSNSVSRIDPDASRVAATVPVGGEPEGIAVGEGAVWVANKAAGTVTRVDPDGGGRRTNPVGRAPIQLAVASTRSGSRRAGTRPSCSSTPRPASGWASRSRSAGLRAGSHSRATSCGSRPRRRTRSQSSIPRREGSSTGLPWRTTRVRCAPATGRYGSRTPMRAR